MAYSSDSTTSAMKSPYESQIVTSDYHQVTLTVIHNKFHLESEWDG